MKLITLLLFSLSLNLNAQQLELVTPLNDSILETSGLIYINQTLITHNDSGNEPFLYEIDTLTGSVERAVRIVNASNVDWEDLTFDDAYIYISDFGNNAGSRTDLKIYKVAISDYFNTPNDSVYADTIQFSYANQVDFTPTSFATNFDAEALISYNDSLYIFTKNWGNNKSDIYAVPKSPGTYSLPKMDSINPQGWVTGATISALEDKIFLTGYTFSAPFLVELTGFTSLNFSNGSVERYSISSPSGYSFQIEGISEISNNYYHVSAEGSSSGNAGIYKFSVDSLLSLSDISTENKVKVYPNPANHFIQVHFPVDEMRLFSISGELLLSTKNQKLFIDTLSKGTYILKISTGKETFTEKVIIR